jgi:hypothetical protein
VSGEIRASLAAVRTIATEFEAAEVTHFVDGVAPDLAELPSRLLTAVEELATLLMGRYTETAQLAPRLASVLNIRNDAMNVARALQQQSDAAPMREELAPMAAQSAPAATLPLRQPVGASGAALSSMLSQGLTGLAALETQPISEPASLDDEIVPIAQLLYRGRDAIERARELRDSIKARTDSPKREELDEIFELLDLAVTE